MLSVLITSVLLFGLFSSYAMAGPGELRLVQVKYDPFPAEAGKYFKLFLRVENLGAEKTRNAVCELDPEFPFSLDPNEKALREMGEIPARGDFLIEYQVRVAKDAVDGDNELKIKCGSDGINDGTYVVHKLMINVDSRNPEFAIGSIKSIPSDIKAGMKDVKIEVELQNVGEGDAKLVTTSLSLPDGFEPSDSYSDSYSIGNFEKDSTKKAVFYIDAEEGIESGDYPANLTVRYKYDNNQWEEYAGQEILMDISVKKSPILRIGEIRAGTGTYSPGFTGYVVRGSTVVSPSTLSQGEKAELRVNVTNEGGEEAESVSLKVVRDSTQPFEFEELYDFIGNLEPGQSGEAVLHFTIDQDAILKSYFLDMEIRYVEGSEVFTEKETVRIEVARENGSQIFFIAVIAVVAVASLLIYWKRKSIRIHFSKNEKE